MATWVEYAVTDDLGCHTDVGLLDFDAACAIADNRDANDPAHGPHRVVKRRVAADPWVVVVRS